MTTTTTTASATTTATATETETLWVTVYAGGSEYLMQYCQVAQRGNGVSIRGEAHAPWAKVLVEKWFPELSPGRAAVMAELITRPEGCYNLPV